MKRTTNGNNKSDEVLVKEFIEGNSRSLYELFERHHRHLSEFGRKVCTNPEDGEEVVQEAYIKALQKLKDFKNRGAVKNWFYTVIKRLCIRKRQKEKKKLQEELTPEKISKLINSKQSHGASELRVAETEELRRVIEVIREIPEKYREIIELKEIDGLSTKRITELLDITEETARIRLFRARKLIRDKLKKKNL